VKLTNIFANFWGKLIKFSILQNWEKKKNHHNQLYPAIFSACFFWLENEPLMIGDFVLYLFFPHNSNSDKRCHTC
jgi:hypothetical protein